MQIDISGDAEQLDGLGLEQQVDRLSGRKGGRWQWNKRSARGEVHAAIVHVGRDSLAVDGPDTEGRKRRLDDRARI